ncbi:hypothetical protein LCGC14_1182670, partial [marine sediment metagenome]
IFVDIMSNGNWMVCNSSVNYIPEEETNKDEDIIVSDMLEFNPYSLEINFSSDGVKFSDFTLGSVLEVTDEILLVAGIFEDSNALGSGLTGQDLIDSALTVTSRVKFRAAAVDALNDFRSGIFMFDRPSNVPKLKYQSPDGLYVSDIDITNISNFLVSESSFFDANGRVIKLNAFFNVIFMFGGGNFNVINDAKALNNGNIVLSL